MVLSIRTTEGIHRWLCNDCSVIYRDNICVDKQTSTSVLLMSLYMTPSRLSEDVWSEAWETLHPQQYARLFRGGTESIVLTDVREMNTVWIFKIQGSSGMCYLIRVNKTTRKAKCDCPDTRSHPGNTCKHICWLVFVLLKLTDLEILAHGTLPESVVTRFDCFSLLAASVPPAPRPMPMPDLSLYASRTPANMSPRDTSISASTPSSSRGVQIFQFALDPESRDPGIVGSIDFTSADPESDDECDEDPEIQGSVFLEGFGGCAPPADAECCVCYEDFESGDESKIVHCPGCRNHFHALCILQWMARGKDSCPLCRHHK